jgi:hypothetical protein
MNAGMTTWLLRVLGAPVERVRDIAKMSLVWRGVVPVEVVIVGTLALGALATWLYWRERERLGPRRRWTLSGLRTLFFLLLLLLFLRPTLVLVLEGTIRQSLLVLVDGTASMNIRDPRTDAEEQRRAALVTPTKNPARIELAQSALSGGNIRLVPRLERELDLNYFQFGQQVEELTTNVVRQFKANRPVTALGDAVRDVVSLKRGQPVAGILLVTDGANNSGSAPLEAAALAKRESMPLFIYGVGMRSPKDVIVASALAEDVVFVKDEVPVTVRVRGQGVHQPVTVTLKLGDKQVDQKEVALTGEGEQIVTMKFTPTDAGEFVLQAEVPPLPDEVEKDNNLATKPIRVIDQKIKVLYVERTPRWEFRYLQAAWLRDRRVELKCVLLEGDPAIASGASSPYLARLPDRREDWLKYDVIVIGDVEPRRFAPAQLEAINDSVAKFGSGLIFVAGNNFNPVAYRGTVLDKLLPIELDLAPPAVGRLIRLDLTIAGRASPMLRLTEDPQENLARWRDLPPIYWVTPVSRTKPAAEVLVTDTAKVPVWVMQRFGMGQVLFVGTDESWRWRKNVGDRYFAPLWGQTVQRMAMVRLLGGAKRTQLIAERQQYLSGERVTIYARLYTTEFTPVTEATVRGSYVRTKGGPSGEERLVQFRPLPGQPGMYRGEFLAPPVGNYQFQVESDSATKLEFRVVQPKFELGDTAMNEPLLQQMAEVSGGLFVREDGLATLPDKINQRAEKVRSTADVEIWCSPLSFFVLLGVLTMEWVLRKRWHLK